MNRISAILICLICSTVSLASWETTSFRAPNGSLIRTGMTKADVRRDAGAPLDRKDASNVKKANTVNSKLRGEVWTYKGSDGVYSISFLRDRVAKIEVAPFRGR